MKPITNEKGAALITALMLTMISLAIVMLLLYYVTTGIQMSASQKRYKTVLEAAYGGASAFRQRVYTATQQCHLWRLFRRRSAVARRNTLRTDNLSMTLGNLDCLQQKLDNATVDWGNSCSKTMDPRDNPDMTFILKSTLSRHFHPTAGFQGLYEDCRNPY